MQWQRPVKLEGALALVERGADSEQRKVQAEREEKVLAQLFLSKSRYVWMCVDRKLGKGDVSHCVWVEGRGVFDIVSVWRGNAILRFVKSHSRNH